MTPPAPELTLVARWFHALADPTRLAIVQRLSDGERCVCELQGELDAAQSRLSFHLRTLKEAGLVSDRREGRWSFYSIRPEALRAMSDHLRAVAPEGRPRRREAACAP